MDEKQPDVFMIGGANGAGKTTSALLLLPNFLDTYEFVNADEIARGLNPLQPDTADMMAGRVMIDRIKGLITSKKNFAFETTCAGRHHVRTLELCAAAGYRLNLLFLWLPSAEMAMERVAERVKQGGDAFPPDTIRRRYAAGLRNLIELYLPMMHNGFILNNTEESPQNWQDQIIAAKTHDDGLTVMDKEIWGKILQETKERTDAS